MSNLHTVKISIYGKDITIKSTEQPMETQKYAEYIDHVMKGIGKKTGSMDMNRIAVLALLHVTRELFTLRKNIKADNAEYEKKVKEFAANLEAVINETGVQTKLL